MLYILIMEISGIDICMSSALVATPPKASTTKPYSRAGIISAVRITTHIFFLGKFVSSIRVGVSSKPINFRDSTAIAMANPPAPSANMVPFSLPAVKLDTCQLPLNRK